MPYRPAPQIANALIAERHQIRLLIANAVDTSFQMAFHALAGKAGEVEKLVYFFMEGLPIMESGLNRILAPHGVSVVVSGVFCHQTPKVKSLKPRPSSASCELGDIALLATYDRMPAQSGMGNALLLQAKAGFHPGRAPDQELLYEATDTFEYVSPRSLTGQRRSLAAANSCLYYWEVDERWWHYHPRLHSTEALLARPRPAHSLGYHHEPFENTVTDLFCGIAGRGFQTSPSGSGMDWTSIIHDLVKNSATRAIRHKQIFAKRGGGGPSRLFNYVSALHEWPKASLVRCSLGEFLKRFGDAKLSEAADRLEQDSEAYQPENDFGDGVETRDSQLPPLNRGDDSSDGDGGGSFAVFQFKSTND